MKPKNNSSPFPPHALVLLSLVYNCMNNNSNMRNLKLITFLLILILATIFYWFQWRPSNIKKDCSGFAERMAADAVRSGMDFYSSQRIALYDNTYNTCLHTQGL